MKKMDRCLNVRVYVANERPNDISIQSSVTKSRSSAYSKTIDDISIRSRTSLVCVYCDEIQEEQYSAVLAPPLISD